ncbi:MAG: hypothetical protein D6722_14990 [Bacteroidetes bacterium]|nr:MAG: hypothetical protein D6722_14990 [Bacteroidota bacterium]
MRVRLAFVSMLWGLACLLPATVQAQSVLLNYYNLTADGSDVLLEWEVQDTRGITEFQIFRRMNNESSGVHVATIPISSGSAYSYLDDDIFKTDGQVIHYELHIVMPGKTETYERSLSHNPTSIQRTWGSIKSMFRY